MLDKLVRVMMLVVAMCYPKIEAGTVIDKIVAERGVQLVTIS
jgi:aspartate carbamoyltransferase regulatory subunit